MSLFKKKLKSENLEELRDIADDVIERDFVPYACHWDKNTIITKNGEVMQIIKITGLMHERLSTAEEDADLRLKIREAITQCVDSDKYAIWVHTIRRKRSLKTGGEYKRDFSGYLDHFWNDKNDWENKFINEVYITLVHEGKDARMKNPQVLTLGVIPRLNNKVFEDHISQACRNITAVTAKMLPVLNLYGARLLGMAKREDNYYSELSEFIGKLVSLRDMEFPVQDVDLSRLLTEYDVTFGFNAMEVRMHADSKRRFGAMLTLRNYRELSLNSLDLVLQAPVEFIITESFEFIPAGVAMQVYESQKEVFLTSKVQQLPEKIGLKDILASNKGRKTDFGQHQMNVFILADTIKSLETGVANMAKALVSIGMTPIREDIKLEECYWAQLPGNFEFIQRMQAINTERIAGFANLNNFPGGSERNNHWGPAVTTFHTAARTPYFFNFHQGDNGHTMIIGQTGAGKTVLLNFLLTEARKFDNKIFYFDYDRSAEILLRSLGGNYYNPYAGADKRPYAQLALNPFALEDTKENKDFLRSWLSSLVSYPDAGALEAACEQAVVATMQKERGQRNLKSCVECMRTYNPAVADAFLPWTEGKHAGIFTANQDSLNFSDKIYGFEMGHVMQDKTTMVPIVSYLLHCILQSLDGSPAILVMDEAWDMLDNAFFVPRLASLFDTLRAKNALMIFATDHADQAYQSTINSLLLDKVATQIYLPDADADDHYAQAFGLTNTEISYIAVMNVEDRHFLIKHDHHTIVCELNLAGMSDIISVLSSVPKNLEIMEEAIHKHGLSSQQWMPMFLEKI